MEIRDLYDENRNLTGKTVEKGQPIPKNRYYLTVAVWIQNSKEEFLLQLTVPEKHHMWSTTGGHPKSGETSLDGIVTEIKEEIGIDVDKNKLELFKTIKTEDDYVDLYYLKMDIDINNITIQEDEVEEVKWASIDEIRQMISQNIFLPPHIEFFNNCIKYLEN
jgi:isopentenyldiphosphate isomerase